MVQKKIMDFNSGAKFHGNFLTLAFLGAGLREARFPSYLLL